MTEQNKPVIVLSGGRTTQPLAKALSEHFQIAVLDQGSVGHFVSQIERVMCPEKGINSQLQSMVTNDAAHLVARAVDALPHLAHRFAMGGVNVPALRQSLSGWMPGLVMALFPMVIQTIRVLEGFTDNYDVRCLVTHEDVTPKFRAAVLYAKTQGIPTIHIPHANHFCNTRPDIHDECLCDWLLAASPWMRDWYVERGFSRERVKVTGCPNWDKWPTICQQITKEHARTILRLEQGRPVVLYCTSWPQVTNLIDDHTVKERADRAMLQVAKAQGWQLIWSLHPGDPSECQQEYAQMAKEASVPAIVVRGHLSYTTRAADVLVTVGPSNVAIEAGLADCPGITIPLRGYGYPGTPPWKAQPTEGTITETINRILANPDEWHKRREWFIRRYAHDDDGKATERIVGEICKIANV